MDVLVDARNVLRSRWPNIPEDELVARCRSYAERTGVRLHLVFDGEAPAAGADAEGGAGCLVVVGSGPESADDVIAEVATRWQAEGRAYRLVTSDRELRRRAGEGAERITGGGAFAGELLAEG